MPQNVYLFQPQYNEIINDKNVYWLPYSVGCLWAYAQSQPGITDHWQIGGIIFQRSPLEQVLSSMTDPVVCGFSSYIWNENYNLELAKLIKERWPQCYILFGGPQVSANYLKYSFIDSIMLAEGELAFVEALNMISSGKELPELFPKTRVNDLQELPSPYVSGVFDRIIADNPDFQWNAVIETNRGCPFSCTFCDWGSLTYSKIKKFNLERVKGEIDWIAANPVASVFVADANFGIFQERDLEIAEYMKQRWFNSRADYVNITYTKNTNENVFRIAKVLYPLTKAVTVSMQSMSEDTLVAIKRDNLKMNDIANAMRLSREYDIPTYSEMILGLPNETYDSWCKGMTDLLEAGQHHHIDVFLTLLIHNSELNQAASKFQHRIGTVAVRNYMTFSRGQGQTDPVPEISYIVNSTRTMSTEEMVESYMYSWLITNIHIMGYSQIISNYCRSVLGVTYREFYDCMMQDIQQGHTFLSDKYRSIRDAIERVLTTGESDEFEHGVNLIMFDRAIELYHRREDIYGMVYHVASKFGNVPQSVLELQRHFVYGEGQPDRLTSELDVDTWQPGIVKYSLQSRVKNFAPTFFNIVLQRKRGLLKNRFVQIDENHKEIVPTELSYKY